jgi:hypothetical protein
MRYLNDEEKIRYLKRSYSTVDGLWFMKVEDSFDFEKALEIDNEVWKVMPKVQARFLKTALGIDKGLEALEQCFTEKLRLDGIEFDVKRNQNVLTITISRCHWHDLMVKSDRENLSSRVGETICNTEYSVWAQEFGESISFKMLSRICSGGGECVLQFSES